MTTKELIDKLRSPRNEPLIREHAAAHLEALLAECEAGRGILDPVGLNIQAPLTMYEERQAYRDARARVDALDKPA